MKTKQPLLRRVYIAGTLIFLAILLGLQGTNASARQQFEINQAPEWEQIIRAQGAGFEFSGLGGWVAVEGVICTESGTNLIYTRTRTPPHTNDVDWARWRPTIPTTGLYDIYIYIPNYTGGSAQPTTQARYQINHANGQNVVIINQTQNRCSWVYLGRYAFNAGTTGNVYMGDYTGDNPYKLISADAVKYVQVATVFSGNPSSRLFVDNNGERINLEVCANNLPGQTVRVQLSRPGHTYNVISQQATGRCVIFWNMDGPGPVLLNTAYTTRAALNQNPNPGWPVPCYTITGGQGLCDSLTSPGSGGSDLIRLPYPGGTTYYLSRNRHGNTPAYDFVLPRNHQVVAARAGTVIAVKQNSSTWACNPNYGNLANYVFVRHTDNSVARYLHLKQNGVLVTPGQIVQRGQLLGYVGLSGYMCGSPPDHLHFEVRSASGVRTIVRFEDTNNSEPLAYRYYTSGNYFGTFLDALDEFIELGQLNNEVPEGLVQFRLNTTSSSNEIKLLGYDYLNEVTNMRLANSEAELENAPWIPYVNTATWNGSTVFVQYKTSDGRISSPYSDTIASTANTPIVTSFALGSTEVCVGEDIIISNNTIPYCPQCSWNWNLGNGFITQSFNPTSDENGAWWEYSFVEGYFDPELSFDTPGVYTVTATVENQNNSSTTSHQITVINSISADFTVVRSGNTVTVTATAKNAVSWEWGFGDGTKATGQTASHTYENLDEVRLITLKTQSINGCTGQSYQFVQNYHIFLPFLKR